MSTEVAHIAFDPAAFRWAGVVEQGYKVAPGQEPADGARGMGWKGVTRHVLAGTPILQAAFEARFFEVAPGGYSRLEKHRHVHFVIGMRGCGRALIGDRMHGIPPFDALHVPPLAPHRWLNEGEEPFGFLCIVDAERDRPQPLDDAEWELLRADPLTAPYVF